VPRLYDRIVEVLRVQFLASLAVVEAVYGQVRARITCPLSSRHRDFGADPKF
jgi:hypothetical protein